MFQVGMGFIVSFYETEPEALSSLYYKVFDGVNNMIEDADKKN